MSYTRLFTLRYCCTLSLVMNHQQCILIVLEIKSEIRSRHQLHGNCLSSEYTIPLLLNLLQYTDYWISPKDFRVVSRLTCVLILIMKNIPASYDPMLDSIVSDKYAVLENKEVFQFYLLQFSSVRVVPGSD